MGAHTIEFLDDKLADVWGLATSSVVRGCKPRSGDPTDQHTATDAEGVDDGESDVDARTIDVDVPASKRSDSVQPRFHRSTRTAGGVVVIALVGVVATVAMVVLPWHLWGRGAGRSTGPSGSANDAAVSQTRCEQNNGAAFFSGSLTNTATEALNFRVDVTFVGQDGRSAGHGSTFVNLLLPGASATVAIGAPAAHIVPNCIVTATRVR